MAAAADGERQMIGACEAQADLDVPWVDWTYYELGMRVKLGCIAFAKLLVLRVAWAKDRSRESSRKGREVGVARRRERTRRGLLRKAGPGKKGKGRTKALPEERTPIHRCPCEGWIWSRVPEESVRQFGRRMREARWSRSCQAKATVSRPRMIHLLSRPSRVQPPNRCAA